VARTTARSGPTSSTASTTLPLPLVNSLLDNIELLAVLVAGLDGLAARRVIGDTIAEVLDQIRSTTQSTGLDPMQAAQQLGTIIPTWQRFTGINRSRVPSSSPSRSTSLARRRRPRRRPEGRRGEENPPRLRGLLRHQGQGRPARPRFVVEVAKVFGRDLDKRSAQTTDGTD